MPWYISLLLQLYWNSHHCYSHLSLFPDSPYHSSSCSSKGTIRMRDISPLWTHCFTAFIVNCLEQRGETFTFLHANAQGCIDLDKRGSVFKIERQPMNFWSTCTCNASHVSRSVPWIKTLIFTFEFKEEPLCHFQTESSVDPQHLLNSFPTLLLIKKVQIT